MRGVGITSRSTSLFVLLGAAGCSSILGLDQPWDLAQGAHCQPGDESFPCAAGLYCEPVSSTCQPTGGGGGGGGGGCVPETTEACTYTGPMGTKDVGTCKAGSRICNQDGAWEPCQGQVVPVAEDCGTPFDENCDGTPNDGCPCEPGTMQACYTGPMATQHVGACQDGTQTCDADGMGYGPCTGDVLPAATDSCETPVDDDCDGTTNEDVGVGASCLCVPSSSDACYTGPMGTQGVGVCAAGSWTCNDQGTAYGACTGETLPGAEDCAAVGDEDCDGFACSETKWAVAFPATGGVFASKAAATPDGGGVVLARFLGTMTVGGNNLISSGGFDFVLLKVDTNGTPEWQKRFGDAANQTLVKGVGTDAAGNVYVGVGLTGVVDFGGGALPTAGNKTIGLAKFDPAGNHVWSISVGGGSAIAFNGMDVGASGNLTLTGSFAGTLDFGSGTGALTSAGANDAFVLRVSANGVPTWAKRFGDAADQAGMAVATDAGGNTFFSGTNSGAFTIAGPINTPNFIGRLDTNGTPVTQVGFTGSTIASQTLVTDALANVWLAGSFGGSVNTGGGNLSSGVTDALVLTKYSSGFAHLYSQVYGGAGSDLNPSLAIFPDGRLFLAARSNGDVDFDGGSTTLVGGYDVVMTTRLASGAHAWSRGVGSADVEQDNAVATFLDGSSFLVFSANNTALDLGLGAVGPGLVLAKIGQ